jgi:hypothetical protein
VDHFELERESMARTRSIDHQKETHWRAQLALHADSGLSIAAWCRQNQVALSIFHYWRQTIARRDKANMAVMPAPNNATAPAFVPVIVAPQPQAPPSTPDTIISETGFIEISFPHRAARLRVAPGFDAPTLSRLLDVLERRAC